MISESFQKRCLMEKIENQMEFLLSAALHRCGNLADAEDLTQETILSALLIQAKGRQIDNLRGWLLTVMERKYFDMLRKRYRQPFVSIGEAFDIIDETSSPEDCLTADAVAEEAARVRREVAFLAQMYREVIVRRYMDGQSIVEIAGALGIPQGTVKSRLSFGRNRMKKGMDDMEHYDVRSYKPVRLLVSNSGGTGMAGEPAALVSDDLIAQNLLYLAYEKPLTVTELARAIGVSAAYVEPILKRLVDGELMAGIGDKFYTDFIIYTREDEERYLPEQKEFIARWFDEIWKPYERVFGELRETEMYRRMSSVKRDALELFCFFNIFDYSSYRTFAEAFEAEQIFPDRPNGGRWIAFGHVDTGEVPAAAEAHKYLYAGQNNVWLENYLDTECIRMSLFYPQGFPIRMFMRGENGIREEQLIKLLYLIESGADVRQSGFEERYLRSIPWLVECNVLHYEDNRPKLSIPVFSQSESKILDSITGTAQEELSDVLKAPLKEFLKGKRKLIPPHLKSVPLQKQYLYSDNAMLMIALRTAMKKGLIRDDGYDNEVQPPWPMILVVEK